jgi:acyl phosphate:glycerol-3-phosphate acyltransferase
MIVSAIALILLTLGGYLLGSIPTGYLLGRYLKGIDIREHGSGSTGATNILRTIGKIPALVVLLVDLIKGAIAVGLVHLVYTTDSLALPENWQYWSILATALAAVIGHSKSIWLNFTGGKSVATTLGILSIMNPLVALGSLITFLVFLAIFRIVSLSSIAAAIAVNILMIALQQPIPYLLFAGLAGAYVIIRHQTNIQRILSGTEPKIGETLPENS